MSEAQENILVLDPEAEKEQNKTGIGITIAKGRGLGAEKDTIKMNHRDGEKCRYYNDYYSSHGIEMVERESPLSVITTLTNGVRLTTTGRIRISIAKAGGLTTPSLERKMCITSAGTEQTYVIVQYLSSNLKNILVKGMHFLLCQLVHILRTFPGKMKKKN